MRGMFCCQSGVAGFQQPGQTCVAAHGTASYLADLGLSISEVFAILSRDPSFDFQPSELLFDLKFMFLARQPILSTRLVIERVMARQLDHREG